VIIINKETAIAEEEIFEEKESEIETKKKKRKGFGLS